MYDDKKHRFIQQGPFRQVSRLGNPLFNEVIVPMAEKDVWNALPPRDDSRFNKYVVHPELGGLLPVLYPGVFPNLAAYTKPRADLKAILLTGLPTGVVANFQNYTGATLADMLRLNVAVPPTDPGSASPYGILGGDLAGFPNGRRLADDIIAIELRAIAGATIPLVDSSYTADSAASALKDGSSDTNAANLSQFPYMGTPAGGYETTPGTPGRELMTHQHPHPENAWAGQGAVMLDIGDDVGALVVHMPADLVGAEIEICPTGDGPQRRCPSARGRGRRQAGSRTIPTAVFPTLREGRYDLYRKPDGQTELVADVVGGAVRELDWPG